MLSTTQELERTKFMSTKLIHLRNVTTQKIK